MSRFVAISQDGTVEVHATHAEAYPYATLCGMDGDDRIVGQAPAEMPAGRPQITCAQCRDIIMRGWLYRRRDFAGVQP